MRPQREFLVSGGQGYSSSDDYVGVPSRRRIRFKSDAQSDSVIDQLTMLSRTSLPARTSALDIRADTFRRLSLLSMSYHTWRLRLANNHERAAQIAVARGAVLQRWTVQRWRARLNHVQNLQRMAITYRQQAAEPMTRARAFDKWKKRVEGRRRAEWEAGLREAWEVVRSGWKNKTRGDCLAVSQIKGNDVVPRVDHRCLPAPVAMEVSNA
jgi:hypothetical protein